MSVARRKDSRGRVLKDGEVQRKNDGLYMFRWTARNGKRHTIYDATLEGLRDKEDKIKHDLADGIRAVESNVTVNDMFTLWRKDKIGIKEHTLTNYVYMYNRFIKDTIGEMRIKDVRKSDILASHLIVRCLLHNRRLLTQSSGFCQYSFALETNY